MKLQLTVGPRKSNGRRLVIVTDDGRELHRDRLDTDDSFKRSKFREAVINKLGLGDDAHVWLEERIIAAADAEDDRPTAGTELDIVNMADIVPTSIDWLWPGRIALGKLTLFVGKPGLGKSFLTLDLAGRISTGAPWPDDRTTKAPLGSVVILTAEDALADTIRPRLDAAGADVSKIVAIRGVKRADENGKFDRMLDLTLDINQLTDSVRGLPDCKLVIIDPVSEYLGAIDSHVNSDVRRALAPLANLASECGVAVVCVSHLRKGAGPAIDSTLGSVAFNAAARTVLMVSRDREDPTGPRRLLLVVKNNLASDQSGLAFELSNKHATNGVPLVLWEPNPVTISADEALACQSNRDDQGSAIAEAADWLRNQLADGPRPSRDLKEAARRDGIAIRTLERAKQQLGAVARQDGYHGGWIWELPGSHTPPKNAQTATHKSMAECDDVGDLWAEGPETDANRQFDEAAADLEAWEA